MQTVPAGRETTRSPELSARAGSILAAACALPGVAAAEGAPTEGLIGFKYLFYQDAQPGLKRITVNSPSVYALTPLPWGFSLEGSIVVDSLSGATPRYHTVVSAASRMTEERTAWDLKLVKYFRRAAIGVGFASSSEHDYESNANSIDLRLFTDDNNTTFTFGYGTSKDKINPTNGGLLGIRGEGKNVDDVIAGVTQVLSPNDIVKLNFTESRGKGYFSDPYKFADNRPRTRNSSAILFQWNHHFDSLDGTLRSTYRSYSDSFEVKANTFGFEYAQSVRGGFVLTPALRYHSQSSAYFYVDPVLDPVTGAPIPPAFNPARFSSADQRLSAFGGITLGFKVEKTFGKWATDIRYDYLQQRGDWRLAGKGSPGLASFTAHMLQFGASRRF
jgi:hypothetical protein